MTDVAWRFSCRFGFRPLAIAIAASGLSAPAAAQTAVCGWLDPQTAAKFSSLAAECAGHAVAISSATVPPETPAILADSIEAMADLPLTRPDSVSVTFGNPVRPKYVRRALKPRFAPPAPSGLIAAVAASHRIDPLLLNAIVARESAGRPDAISHKGAIGLMQVMPATAFALGVTDPAQLRDPTTSLVAGATYLKQMQARFGNDLALTLAAYNAGPGAVARYRGVPPYAETQSYVTNILTRYRAARAGIPR